MWGLYQTAEKLGQKPSSWLPTLDPLWALQLDQAVVYFGIVIENALAERVEVGSGNQKRSEAKYTLTQLLDPTFRLPAPGAAGQGKPLGRALVDWMRGMIGQGERGFRSYKVKNS